MRFAVCITDSCKSDNLSQLLNLYKQQHSIALSYEIFGTDKDLLCGFIPGEYDAVFCGGEESNNLTREIRIRDAGVQIIRLLPIDSKNSEIIGYCLPEQVSPLFLFPVLDKLFDELSRLHGAKLLIKKRGCIMYLPFSQIEYVEVCRRVVLFYLVDGHIEEATGNFADYEDRMLQWPDFVKVHRSYIVNLRCVSKLTADSLLTLNGHTVPISKLIYPQFKKDYLSGVATALSKQSLSPSMQTDSHDEHTYRILLIDDQYSELERWSDTLTKKGCMVCTASTSEDALILAEQGSFDCVLLDVQLGNKSGYDLCNELVEKTGAPVLYLSTLNDTEHQIKGFKTGGADFITKDTPAELIWLKIERHIETAKLAKPQLINGSVRIDLRHRQAFINEQTLTLTSVEFDLLCILLQNPNIPYTPEKLYRLVWGARQWDDGHTVQMHMTLLCNKLEQRFPHHVFIDSVWGEGYRFVPES